MSLDDEKNIEEQLIKFATKQAAAYGHCLDLLAAINNITFLETLLANILAYFSSLDLSVVIEVREESKKLHFNTEHMECSQIEIEIFSKLKDLGRIYLFSTRCMFNGKNISILIKNMPASGSVAYDLIIDVIAKLIPVIDHKLIDIHRQKVITETHHQMKKLIGIITDHLSLNKNVQQQFLDGIGNKIRESFHVLEMTEKQESYFQVLLKQETQQLTNNKKIIEVHQEVTICSERLSSLNLNPFTSSENLDEQIDEVILF